MGTITIVGPSDIGACAAVIGVDESVIRNVAGETGVVVARQQHRLVAVPYKGTGYHASKGYVEAGGKELCGILPTGVRSGIATKEIINVKNWVRQPEALVSRASIMVVVGMSAGTLIEICMTKRYKKYPVLIFKELLTSVPKEIEREVNIQYLSGLQDLAEAMHSVRCPSR